MGSNIPDSLEFLKDLLREGISTEEVKINYDNWATSYDKDVEKLDYEAYTHAANKASELYPPEMRINVKILDVGAGTGLLGSKLRDIGFKKIDGLDPSDKSLDVARGKGIYDRYINQYLTEDPLDIEQETYDMVTGSGMIGYSLVPYGSIIEMVRLTKPGGYIILSILESVLEYKELEGMVPLIEKMVGEGKIKIVSRTVYPHFIKDEPGVLFVLQRL